jgi:hypothetical protein
MPYKKTNLLGKNQYGFKSSLERFHEKYIKNKNCWEWIGTKIKSGYGQIAAKGKLILSHLFSYELYYGEFNKKLHVLHKCDNPSCVNPDHLFLGTDRDNSLDCRLKGRDTCFKKGQKSLVDNRGSKSGKAKLNEEKVKDIKYRLQSNETIASIARFYCISSSIISGIKHGYRWSHVQGLRRERHCMEIKK